jgi:hypothetical protein
MNRLTRKKTLKRLIELTEEINNVLETLYSVANDFDEMGCEEYYRRLDDIDSDLRILSENIYDSANNELNK